MGGKVQGDSGGQGGVALCKWLVCPACRAVSVAAPTGTGTMLLHVLGCSGDKAAVEAYTSHAEALARGAGLWFASLRGVGPDRVDTVQPVDYTDPYFREGR